MKRVLFLSSVFYFCITIFALPMTQFYESVSDSIEEKSEKELPTFFTLKDKLKYEFDNTHWLNGDNLKTKDLPIPYNIGEVTNSEAYTYSQTDSTAAIYPQLEGLGVLDYFGIPYSDMMYCEKIATCIQKKSIQESDVSVARQFIKYFFETVLNGLPSIESVFYGRPEIVDDTLQMSFRLNFSKAAVRSLLLYNSFPIDKITPGMAFLQLFTSSSASPPRASPIVSAS